VQSKVTGSSLINLSHQQIADEPGSNRVVVPGLLKQLENDKNYFFIAARSNF